MFRTGHEQTRQHARIEPSFPDSQRPDAEAGPPPQPRPQSTRRPAGGVLSRKNHDWR